MFTFSYPPQSSLPALAQAIPVNNPRIDGYDLPSLSIAKGIDNTLWIKTDTGIYNWEQIFTSSSGIFFAQIAIGNTDGSVLQNNVLAKDELGRLRLGNGISIDGFPITNGFSNNNNHELLLSSVPYDSSLLSPSILNRSVIIGVSAPSSSFSIICNSTTSYYRGWDFTGVLFPSIASNNSWGPGCTGVPSGYQNRTVKPIGLYPSNSTSGVSTSGYLNILNTSNSAVVDVYDPYNILTGFSAPFCGKVISFNGNTNFKTFGAFSYSYAYNKTSLLTTIDLGNCPSLEFCSIAGRIPLQHLNIVGSTSLLKTLSLSFENGIAIENITGVKTLMEQFCPSLENLVLTNINNFPTGLTLNDGTLKTVLINLMSGVQSINIDGNTSLTSMSIYSNSGLAFLSASGVGANVNPGTSSVNLSNNNLSANALNYFFSGLASNPHSATLNVAGNPGASGCDPTIATAKGWSVSI